jgi:two-component system cell cycle response regulator
MSAGGLRGSRTARVIFGVLALMTIVDAGLLSLGLVHGAWLTPHRVLYEAIIAGAAGLCALRPVGTRDERLVWSLLAAGLGFWAGGQLYFTVAGPVLPFPSWADLLWLAFYIPTYAAIVLLVRSRLHHVSRAQWFDGVIGALGVTSVSAAVVFGAVLHASHGSLGVIATNLAYPVADLMLLSLLVAVAVTSGRQLLEPMWLLILAALVVFTVADSVYLVQLAEGTYVNYGLLDAGWPVALLLLGGAAWQPKMQVDVRRQGRPSVGIPIALSTLALGVLIIDHFHRTNLLALSLASLCVVAVFGRLVIAFRDNRRMLEATHSLAMTDPVTGLGSRYQLMRDLEQRLGAKPVGSSILILADLDGFKHYNDTFGHPAGDALLHRLGAHLRESLGSHGTAHRMGGDEFCALVDLRPHESHDTHVARCQAALSEQGKGFSISASCGAVTLHGEGQTAEDALKIADRRMYANKRSGRVSALRQSADVLLAILQEGDLALSAHLTNVGTMAELTARAVGLDEQEVARIRLAGELHDIGKVAIPDEILRKSGPVTAPEWAFIRQHTIIGQRIVAVAPRWHRSAS